jgi:hypothetical protein
MRKFILELIHGPGRMRRLEDRIDKLEKQVSVLESAVLYDDGSIYWRYQQASDQITMRDALKALYRHLGLTARWNRVEARRVMAEKLDTVSIGCPASFSEVSGVDLAKKEKKK